MERFKAVLIFCITIFSLGCNSDQTLPTEINPYDKFILGEYDGEFYYEFFHYDTLTHQIYKHEHDFGKEWYKPCSFKITGSPDLYEINVLNFEYPLPKLQFKYESVVHDEIFAPDVYKIRLIWISMGEYVTNLKGNDSENSVTVMIRDNEVTIQFGLIYYDPDSTYLLNYFGKKL